MLRAGVLALLIANLGFFAWSEGWLGRWVAAPGRGEREPERLLRQVRPETIRVIAPGAPMPAPAPASAASASASAAAPALACLESAPMNAAQAAAAEAALKRLSPPLPAQSWVDDAVDEPASWLVYMGRYAAAETLARKEEELRRRHLDFERVQAPAALAPGLSLGRYDAKPAADAALAALTGQGIHTARVVQASPAATTHVLRFAAVNPAVAAQVSALRGEAYGKGFSGCGGASSSSAGAAGAASSSR